jgi:NADH:ubiquinone oxidoreductase subunit 5 (subunit L)/multisubunit Na+/H+ antiporter MnhA subunit
LKKDEKERTPGSYRRFSRTINKQQKNIVLVYSVFLWVLILFFSIIIGYAIHEKHIAGYADVDRSVTDKEEAFWIRLTIVALVDLVAFSSIIVAGLLLFLRKKGDP